MARRFPDARCLDGTMAGYYVRKGEVGRPAVTVPTFHILSIIDSFDSNLNILRICCLDVFAQLYCSSLHCCVMLPGNSKQMLVFLEGGGWCHSDKFIEICTFSRCLFDFMWKMYDFCVDLIRAFCVSECVP